MVASRVVLRVAVACLLAATGILAVAPRCWACGCVFRSPAKVVAAADAVFVGVVTAETPVDPVTTIQTFEVRRVFKGAVLSRIDVVAQIGPGGGSSCAVLFPPGAPVAVAVHRNDDGTWSSDACSVLTITEVEKVAGRGGAAVPAPPTPSATRGPSATDGSAARDPSGAPSFPGWLVPLLGGAGGVLLIALSFLVGRRRARLEATAAVGPAEAGDAVDWGSADPPGPLR